MTLLSTALHYSGAGENAGPDFSFPEAGTKMKTGCGGAGQ